MPPTVSPTALETSVSADPLPRQPKPRRSSSSAASDDSALLHHLSTQADENVEKVAELVERKAALHPNMRPNSMHRTGSMMNGELQETIEEDPAEDSSPSRKPS